MYDDVRAPLPVFRTRKGRKAGRGAGMRVRKVGSTLAATLA